MAIEPVHCDSSSILKVLFLGQPVCFLVFMFVSVCLRLRLSAPSRLDLRVRWRLQNVFVSVLLFMSVFPCIYVCVCLSQPLLVWIWESVEDCKTFLCLRLFICFIIICVFVFVSMFVSVCLSHFSSGSESPLKIAKPQRGSFPPNKGCNGCCPQE